MSDSPGTGLTVAITGPTGTFGAGLVPLLEADERVGRIVGVARSPFDPASRGWTSMEYRQGDVRDPATLRDAFEGVDVVVHLAFLITGNADPATLRAVNVDGTLEAFRAAAAAGATRFVNASSVAAYGFHADNPAAIGEDWPVRPADRLFYAQDKAETDRCLQEAARAHPATALYQVRPTIVVGPNALGGKDLPAPLPALIAAAGRVGELLGARPGRLPVPLPVLAPTLRLQFVHSDDVGDALRRCVVGDGPPGAYNLAGEGVVGLDEVLREVGAYPVPVPDRLLRTAARATARLPLPPTLQWVEAAAAPPIVDTTRAHEELGWRPRWTGLEALRDTLDPGLTSAGPTR